MKLILGLIVSLLSITAIASSGETRTFSYDGNQSYVEFLLRGEETHTEYRNEQRRSTCTRTIFAGYRTVCRSSGPRGPRYCQQIPHYRTDYYPCWITVSVPYEVKDYDVEANVSLDIKKLPDAITTGETFKIILNGPKLTLEAQGSKKYFLVAKREEVRTQVSGNVKFITGTYEVELIEAAPVLSALNIGNLHYEFAEKKFNFDTRYTGNNDNIGVSFNVLRKPVIGAGYVVFDRELVASEVQLDGTKGVISLDQLGIELNGNRFTLTPKLFAKFKGTLLNEGQFNGLEASRTLLIKL